MHVEEFVQHLSMLAPSRQSLQNVDFSEEEIVAWMGRFRPRKKREVSESGFTDALLQLVDTYDASSVDIASVRFSASVTNLRSAYLVGYVEGDDLLVDPMSFEVRCEESGYPGHVLCRCAADGSAFLHAMILIAEFYSSTPLGMDPSTNKEAARDCARRCAAAAGGEAYLSFYQMLTGGHDD